MNLKKNSKKNAGVENKPVRSKKIWQNGLYSALLCVAVLAVVVLVNLVVRALPTKYTQYDVSTGAMFTLSDTSKTLLSELDRDVTAYYLAQTGAEDGNVTNLLGRYADESSHFSWQQRDPVLYPTFAQQFDGASTGCVVLVCGDKNRVVGYNELYEMDLDAYYNDGSMSYNFQAENALTSALAQVTRTSAYTLYQLTGHGELALESDFTDMLTNAGIAVADLNLTTAGSVPQDAAGVIIHAPAADITTAEQALLQAYFEGGGRLLLATDFNVATPNLDGLAALAGMSRQPGLLVETNADNYPYGYPQTYLLPNLQSNEVTAGVASGLMIFAPVAQGITYDSESVSYTYNELLATSNTAFAMQDYATAETAQRAENDPEGAFPIAVAAEGIDNGGRMVWVNCANLFTAGANQSVSGGNAQLLGSIANWLTGAQTTAVIDGKSMSAATLVVPATSVMVLGVLFTLVLPLVCLIAGAAVCLVRRRR